ncbi:MAG: ABC transporter permease [Acidobacteria bacterium]|nr:ABC transporter permease [Acidobacteriota bacterium]
MATALSTAVFAVVDVVLFQPLPYRDPAHLFVASGPDGNAASIRDIAAYAAAVPEVQFSAYVPPFNLGATVGDAPARLHAAAVDRHFFDVVGISPVVGGLAPTQFEPASGPVPALVTFGVWQRHLGSRPDAVGQRLAVAGAVNHVGEALGEMEVAGILPPDFVFPDGDWAPDVLVPLRLTGEQQGDRAWSAALALARLPEAVTGQVLSTRLNALALDPVEGSQAARQGNGVKVVDLETSVRGLRRDGYRTAFGVASLIVLLAGINVAGLGLARRRQQHREYAVRRALGASTAALSRLAVVESLPLVGFGAAVGLAATPPLMRAAVALLPPGSLLEAPVLDSRPLTFCALQALLMLVTTTVVQLRAALPPSIAQAMGTSHTTPYRWHRLAAACVVAQVAVAFVLTTTGTLSVSSLWLNWQQHPGYDVDHGLLLQASQASRPRGARLPWLREVADQVRGVAGVDAVGVLGASLLDGSTRVVGVRTPPGAKAVRQQAVPVAEDFFEAMGIAAVEGRVLTAEEVTSGAAVAAVSARAAAELWPDASPIGQVLVSADGRTSRTVVGVVPEAQYSALGQSRYGQIYWPFDGGGPDATLVIRTARPPATVLPAVMARLRASPAQSDLIRVTTIQAALGDSIRFRRFDGWFFGGLALAGLVITMVGVLALMAMATAQRTRELGVRVALGATRLSLLWTCLRETFALVLGGVAIGAAVAAWSVTLVRSTLFQVTAYDGRLWSLALAVVVTSAAVGALAPAWRASRVNPITALRAE